MLYHLVYPFYEIYGFLNIFRYITFRSITAGVLALILTIIIGRFYIKSRAGKIYSIKSFIPENHKKKKNIPNNGGVIIVLCTLLAVAVAGNFTSINLWILLIGFVAFAILGYLDDSLKKIENKSLGIRAKKKFIIQILISVVVMMMIYYSNPVVEFVLSEEEKFSEAFTNIYIPFTKNFSINTEIVYWFLGVFIITASANAVNLTDGLDGLAIGLSLFVILTFIIIAYTSGNLVVSEYLKTPYLSGNAEVTVFLAAVAGSCLGFLWYNCHPAQVFMGDTGSLALGSVIGMSSLLLKIEVLLPLIAGVFVLEALSVIIQVFVYKYWKKRIFKMAPLHHHFEMIGWHESKIIFRFWIIGVLLSLIALASLKIR